MTERDLAPWLADISANILCVVLIVLVVTALTMGNGRSTSTQVIPVILANPESAADTVELLRQRLVGSVALIDLTAERPTIPPGTEQVLIYIFDQKFHHVLVTRLITEGRNWREITVPQALRATDGTGFSYKFGNLIENAEDPAQFRRDLTQLLSGEPRTAKRNFDVEIPARPLVKFGDSFTRGTFALFSMLLVLGIWLIGRRLTRLARQNIAPLDPC